MKQLGSEGETLPRGRARGSALTLLVWGLGCAAAAGDGSASELPGSSGPMGSMEAPPEVSSTAGVGGAPNAPLGSAGTGGSVASGESGAGVPSNPDTTADVGATPDAGATPPTPPATSGDPIIPAVTAQCPKFEDSVVAFMGLPGVQIMAGPKPAGPTAPMVFYWHGTSAASDQFERYTALVEGVREEGGVLISFQSSAGPDLTSGTFVWGFGDIPLVDQLVACAVRDHNVDPRRIYTTGCSAGGLFSAALAAERSQYIAATATDSGGWLGPIVFQNDYTPALMTVHGAPGTDVVVVDFSVTSATADEGYKSRGGFPVNCNHGGGHCDAWVEGLDRDMWNFLEAHPYGVVPHPWGSGLPSDVHPSCELY